MSEFPAWIDAAAREFGYLVNQLCGAYATQRGTLPLLGVDETCKDWGVLVATISGDSGLVVPEDVRIMVKAEGQAWCARTRVPAERALLSMLLLPDMRIVTTIEEHTPEAIARLSAQCRKLRAAHERLARASAGKQVPS